MFVQVQGQDQAFADLEDQLGVGQMQGSGAGAVQPRVAAAQADQVLVYPVGFPAVRGQFARVGRELGPYRVVTADTVLFHTAEAARLRVQTRERYMRLLREVLGLPTDEPQDHALRGYLGFLDAACLSWADAGCPTGHRSAIVEIALGALAGALRAAEGRTPT